MSKLSTDRKNKWYIVSKEVFCAAFSAEKLKKINRKIDGIELRVAA